MSDYQIEYHATDSPSNLPSCNDIVQHCITAGRRQNGICFEINGIPQFWIKYGSRITLGEALTQNQVAEIVNLDPASVVRVPKVYFVFLRQQRRYMVMQHVAGDSVESRKLGTGKYFDGDVAAVAAAIKQLISIRVPAGNSPGHVGGGPIGHDFFHECKSTCEYPTVRDLQDQINKLVAPRSLSVDYSIETADGLVLCPSAIKPSDFIIDSEGMVFAINFSYTGYMPASYVSYSLQSWRPFTRLVAPLVDYPISDNLIAMQEAAGILVMGGNNSLGVSTKPQPGR